MTRLPRRLEPAQRRVLAEIDRQGLAVAPPAIGRRSRRGPWERTCRTLAARGLVDLEQFDDVIVAARARRATSLDRHRPVGMTTATVRLLGSLLPLNWPGRGATIDVCRRLDARHAGDGSAVLLQAWRTWRATGDVPQEPLVRDLLGVLGTLLGGIASEMRSRPRLHRRSPAP